MSADYSRKWALRHGYVAAAAFVLFIATGWFVLAVTAAWSGGWALCNLDYYWRARARVAGAPEDTA